MERKVFYVDFDETKESFGFSGIALTKTPANKEFFVAMRNEIQLYLNEEKQMLYGPLLIPEQRILRYTKELGYFDIVFSKEVIAKLARNLQLKTVPFNYEHDPKKKVNGILQEVWLTGVPDKSNAWGWNLPEGSLFGGTFIPDKEFWLSEVKTKNVLGYSIEANMELLLSQLKQINMKKIKLAEVVATDGTLIKTESEMMEVGTLVYTEVDGEAAPVPAGEYDLGNGTIIVVDAESKIAEIKETANAATTLDTEMEAVLNPFLKPLMDKITALETKLAAIQVKMTNQPAAKTVVKKIETGVKMSAQDIFSDWAKRKAALKK